MQRGEVRAVALMPQGSELTADLASGAQVLTIDNPVDFDEDGGTVNINGDVYDYLTVDMDTGTVTLASATTAAAIAGDRVNVIGGGALAIDFIAFVSLGDGDEVEVSIPYAQRDMWPEGEYDAPIIVDLSDDLDTILDVPGRTPLRDGSYIDPDTLPAPSGSDGNPPGISPTPVVTGGIGAFYLRWQPPINADPMRFEVHVDTADGFTPGPTTLYTETGTYSVTVRNLPVIDSTTGAYAPFGYNTPYYFRIIAKDADGSAAPGASGSGMLVQVNNVDIAANSITADQIVTGTLTGDLFAGTVVLGSTISTGALDQDGNIAGARIDLGPNGLIIYDSSGQPITAFPLDQNGQAFIRQAHLEVLSADVIDNFVMHGRNNRIDASAKLTLGKGIEPPSATAQLAQTYDTVQFDVTTVVTGSGSWPMGSFAFNASEARSMAWDDTNTCWRVIQEKSSGFRQWRFNADGSIKMNPFAPTTPWVDDFKGYHKASCSAQGLLFTNNADWIMWGASAVIPAAWIINTNQDPYLAWDPAGGSAGQHMLCQSAQQSGSRPIQIRRFTLNSSGVPVNASIANSPNGLGYSQRINGMYYGSADLGGVRYVNTYETNGHVSVWTTSARYNTNGAYQEWDLATAPQAFAHDGVSFWSLAASGVITKYTGWTWTAQPATTWVGMSAFDSRTAGDQANPWPGQSPGQHETAVGGLSSLNMRRRSKLLITVPVTQDSGGNDDPNQWRVYWARTAATPAKADLHLVSTLGSSAVPTAVTMLADSAGANPPGGIAGQTGAANNFPAGNPAQFASAATDLLAAPLIDLRGDGSGRMGPFKWDSTGKDLTKNGLFVGYNSSATGNVPTAVFNIVGSWSVDPASTAPEFNGGAPGGVFTILVAGMYLVIASVSIASGGSANPTRRITALFKNSVEIARVDTGAGGVSGANPSTVAVERVMRMTPSDTLTVQCWQNSGSTLALTGNPGHSLQLIKLSD